MEILKCPVCGSFLKDIDASVNVFYEILRVKGECHKHGEVEPTNWDYETFFPEEMAKDLQLIYRSKRSPQVPK